MSALSPDWASVGLGWVVWGALGRSCEAAGWVKEPAAGSGSAEVRATTCREALAGPLSMLCFSFLSGRNNVLPHFARNSRPLARTSSQCRRMLMGKGIRLLLFSVLSEKYHSRPCKSLFAKLLLVRLK